MNERSPRGSFQRALVLSLGVATLHVVAASTPVFAAPTLTTPAALLPQQVGGMLGFLGRDETDDDSESKLKATIREQLADAGASDVPARPGRGKFEEKERGDKAADGSLNLLQAYAPLAGGWSNVLGTAFDDARLPDAEAATLGIHGTDGSRAVLANNNGAAYDPESHVFYFWGGGGSSYGGNEVYRLDLETLQPEQISTPSALTQPMEGTSCLAPSDGPAASSTYDGIVWSEATQTMFVFPTDRFCPEGVASPDSIWEFNPEDGSWTAVASLGGLRGRVMAEYDRTTDQIWVVTTGSPATLRHFDPLTGSLSEGSGLGVALKSAGSAVMRGKKGELLLLAREGLYAIPVATPAATRRLGDMPAKIDPRVGVTFDATTDRLVLWTGGREIRTFDFSAEQWETFAPSTGPTGTSDAVLSKWIFIPELSIFAGYHDPAEGLWLYRLPANLPGRQPSNRTPVADAGPDAAVPVRSTFPLIGSNSFDPDRDNLTFAWQIVQKPEGSAASLASATANQSSLIPDVAGQYVMRLAVSDGQLSDTDTVTILAANTAPQANAGLDREGSVGSSMTLNGGNSFDSNQDPLSYSWTLIAKPSASTTTVKNATTKSPSIMLDVAGAFVLQLVVSDGIVESAADTVRIEVADRGSTPAPGNPGDLKELSEFAPATGAWSLVPGTALNRVLLTEDEAFAAGVRGTSGPRSVLTAWNGAAFDKESRTFYFFGGGHGNYGGNEVYSLNFETLELRRRSDPSPLTDTTTEAGACLPASGPASGHTYSGFVWSDATKRALQFSSMGFNKNSSGDCSDFGGNWIAEFDPAADEWTRVSQYSGTVLDGSIDRAIGAPMCGASDKTGLIYCLNGQSHGNLHVYDPSRRKMICRSEGKTADRITVATAFYQDGYLYYSGGHGLNRIPVDGIDGKTGCEFQEEKIAPEIQGISVNHGFQVRSPARSGREEIYAWNGDHQVWKWTIGESVNWTTLMAGPGPAPTKFRGKYDRVLTKWVYLPDLDAFAGYNNQDEGLWLYRPPTDAQAQDAIDAAKAEAKALGFECSDDISGWQCPNLQTAIDQAPAGGTLTLKKGVYNQCARIEKRLTLDGNGSVVKDKTCDGKGTLILRKAADQSTIMNLECRDVFRCVRREVPSLTLKNVYFHDAKNGLQGHRGSEWGEGVAGYIGTITIEDSTFSHFGKDGLHHAIYIANADQLIIRRSKFLCSTEGDHEIKTGARKTVIEDTLIDSQDCVDSRAIDAYNGGEVIIRRSTLVEGLQSENRQIIGYNWEKRVQFPVARVEITDSTFVCNKTASIIRSGTPGPSSITFRNNSLTGACIDVP